jgi:hypothetical protein
MVRILTECSLCTHNGNINRVLFMHRCKLLCIRELSCILKLSCIHELSSIQETHHFLQNRSKPYPN